MCVLISEYQGVRRTGREADHSSASSAQFTNKRNYDHSPSSSAQFTNKRNYDHSPSSSAQFTNKRNYDLSLPVTVASRSKVTLLLGLRVQIPPEA